MSNILIVDDEPNILLSLEFLMQQHGYQTATAQNGDEALALAGSFAPDLVLLDVMLPQRNGIEVCRMLRAGPLGGRVKIILLTARGRAADIENGQRAGADAYITKPFSTKDLLAQVRAQLGDQQGGRLLV
ncbi:MAG: hypothetical protein OHK0022_00340 [Roseiflexaceae bacterium]